MQGDGDMEDRPDQDIVGMWRQFAQISGIGFEAIAALGLGVALGLLLDAAVPALGYAGAFFGGVAGSGLAIYLMVRGLRSFFAESDAEAVTTPPNNEPPQ
jgi:hypothetical protein